MDLLTKELEAQKKRVAALSYLKTQGQDIKSNSEIVKDIDKKSSRTGGDNTLELLFKQKVSDLDSKTIETSSKVAILNHQNSLHGRQTKATDDVELKSPTPDSSNDYDTDLPHGWSKVLDNSTMKHYYWNQTTNETRWDKPEPSLPSSSSSSELKVEDVVEGDWMQKVHAATKQLYWVNTNTGEKCFDKDKPKTVIKSNNSVSKTNAANQSKEKKRKYDIDPLDITGGRVSNTSFTCVHHYYKANIIINGYAIPINNVCTG